MKFTNFSESPGEGCFLWYNEHVREQGWRVKGPATEALEPRNGRTPTMGRKTKTVSFDYDAILGAGPEEDLDFEENQANVVRGLRSIAKEALSAEALQNEETDILELAGLFNSLIAEKEGYLPFEAREVFEKLYGRYEDKRQAAFAKIAEGFADLVDLAIDEDCDGFYETVETLEDRGELN